MNQNRPVSGYWNTNNILHPLRKAEADIALLRSALAGLIGTDTEDELRQIETTMRQLPAPEADKVVSINAIHALLATMPNSATPAAPEIMMQNEFTPETRYVVFKIKDLFAYLTNDDIHALQVIGQTIEAGRAMDARPPLNTVVVEQDWPEFESTWAAIKKRMLQEECEHDWKWYQIAGEGQICAKCCARNYNCDD